MELKMIKFLHSLGWLMPQSTNNHVRQNWKGIGEMGSFGKLSYKFFSVSDKKY